MTQNSRFGVSRFAFCVWVLKRVLKACVLKCVLGYVLYCFQGGGFRVLVLNGMRFKTQVVLRFETRVFELFAFRIAFWVRFGLFSRGAFAFCLSVVISRVETRVLRFAFQATKPPRFDFGPKMDETATRFRIEKR